MKAEFQLKLQKLRVELKKNMSDSLKTNFLFIGLHLSVNEVRHLRNFDKKIENSLVSGWLEENKKNSKFSKKRALK